MAFKASEFQTLRKSEEMNAPTDKDRWVSPIVYAHATIANIDPL